MLGCLSTGLLYYLRSEQTQNLCQLMRNLDSSPDYTNVIHQLLRGAHSLLLRATNIRTGCRLALLPNADLSRALIFEPDRAMSAADGYGAAAAPAMDVRDSAPQIHVTEIQLENTLLLDAVQKGKARFVSDCASYIQSCMKPATDIFISGQVGSCGQNAASARAELSPSNMWPSTAGWGDTVLGWSSARLEPRRFGT